MPPSTNAAPTHPVSPVSTAQQRRTDLLAWIAFLTLAIGFSAVPVFNALRINSPPKDYSVWHDAGRLILAGADLYPSDPNVNFPFMYPPASAVLLYAPLSILPPAIFTAVLALLNAAAWLVCIHLAVFLVTGKAFRQRPLLYIAPLAITLFYVWDTFLLGQPNLVLLAIMLGAFALLRTQRPLLAGALIAAAAAWKAFPILAVGWLLWRRQWRALAGVALGLLLFLVLLPAPFRGFQRNLHELDTWTSGMVFRVSGETIAQRPDITFTYKTQSLLSVSNRLLRPVPAGGLAGEPTFHINVADLPPRTVITIAVAAAAGLGLLFVLAMPPRRARSQRSDALEWSALLILTVLCTPLAWTYTMCWLLPAFTVALHCALERPRGSRRRAAAFAAIGASVLLLATSLSQPWSHLTQALGLTMWGAHCIELALFWLLRSEPRALVTATET